MRKPIWLNGKIEKGRIGMKKHIHHLEDLILFHDKEELAELMTALFFDVYRGTKLGHLSIKYDGSPCIVYGIDDDNQPFISTKSFFNKTPVFYKNKQEMEDRNIDPKLQKKLLFYLKTISAYERVMKHLSPGDWFAADVLKDPFCDIGEGRSRPNLLEYEFGDWAKTVPLVYTIHTKSRPKAWLLPGSIENDCIYPPSNESFIFNLRDITGHILDGPSEFENELAAKDALRDINRKIREFTVAYYHDYNHQALRVYKEHIIKYLNGNVVELGEVYYKGKPTNHEGFVYKYKGQIVKLVNRLEFSARNFSKDFTRAWE